MDSFSIPKLPVIINLMPVHELIDLSFADIYIFCIGLNIQVKIHFDDRAKDRIIYNRYPHLYASYNNSLTSKWFDPANLQQRQVFNADMIDKRKSIPTDTNMNIGFMYADLQKVYQLISSYDRNDKYIFSYCDPRNPDTIVVNGRIIGLICPYVRLWLDEKHSNTFISCLRKYVEEAAHIYANDMMHTLQEDEYVVNLKKLTVSEYSKENIGDNLILRRNKELLFNGAHARTVI